MWHRIQLSRGIFRISTHGDFFFAGSVKQLAFHECISCNSMSFTWQKTSESKILFDQNWELFRKDCFYWFCRLAFSFRQFAFQTVRISRDSILKCGKLTASTNHRNIIHRWQFPFNSGLAAFDSEPMSLTVKLPGQEVPKPFYGL